MIQAIIFYMFAAVVVASGLMVILARNPVHSVLFLILAFVSIGLEFSFGSLKEAGWKPVLVFLAATVVNLSVGLLLATVLWSGFTM